MTRVVGMVVLTLLGVGWPLHAQASSGPRRGSLVLTGGEFGTGVIERFAALAGGAGASVVYIPSASSGIELPSGYAGPAAVRCAPLPNFETSRVGPITSSAVSKPSVAGRESGPWTTRACD